MKSLEVVVALLALNMACSNSNFNYQIDIKPTNELFYQHAGVNKKLSSQEYQKLLLRLEQELEQESLLKPVYSKTEAVSAAKIIQKELKSQGYKCLDTTLVTMDLVEKHNLPFQAVTMFQADIGIKLKGQDFYIEWGLSPDKVAFGNKKLIQELNGYQGEIYPSKSLTREQLISWVFQREAFFAQRSNPLSKKVLQNLEKAAQLNDRNQEAFLGLGAYHQDKGNLKKAKQYFKKAKSIGNSKRLNQYKRHYHF